MNSLADRMQIALDNSNLKWARAAIKLGCTPQATTKWKKGQISKETLKNFAELTNVNLAWLMTGIGNINNSTQIETQYNHNNIQTTAKNNIRLAPVVNTIQAGNFTNIGDDVFDDYSFYFGDYGDDAVYWLRFSGNSMLPDFQDGEFVLINTDRQAVAGNYVVAIKDGETKAIFAKYRPKGHDDNGVAYFYLIPSNDDFPIIDSRFEPFTILGVAVERNQKLV